jgi:hypothetical protein
VVLANRFFLVASGVEIGFGVGSYISICILGSIVIEEEVIARVSSWTIGCEGLTSEVSLVLFVPVCSDY